MSVVPFLRLVTTQRKNPPSARPTAQAAVADWQAVGDALHGPIPGRGILHEPCTGQGRGYRPKARPQHGSQHTETALGGHR